MSNASDIYVGVYSQPEGGGYMHHKQFDLIAYIGPPNYVYFLKCQTFGVRNKTLPHTSTVPQI